jgi:hypothetical protein
MKGNEIVDEEHGRKVNGLRETNVRYDPDITAGLFGRRDGMSPGYSPVSVAQAAQEIVESL